jgi:hypothetical protein
MEFIKWLVTSSADPTEYSTTVKGALTLGVAAIMQVMPITCGLHIICVDQSILISAVDTTATIVYLALSLIGACQVLFGFARKFWLGRVSAYVAAPANLPTA